MQLLKVSNFDPSETDLETIEIIGSQLGQIKLKHKPDCFDLFLVHINIFSSMPLLSRDSLYF